MHKPLDNTLSPTTTTHDEPPTDTAASSSKDVSEFMLHDTAIDDVSRHASSMIDSHASAISVDSGQHAPPLPYDRTSSASAGKRVSFVLQHMDPKLQVTFDPLIQKFRLPAYVLKTHKGPKKIYFDDGTIFS